MPNRTLRSTTRNVVNGTDDIFVASVSSANLDPGSWVKVNDDQTLIPKATIEISDVENLEDTLAALETTTLASTGGTESLVVDGVGPDISIKGFTAGSGVTLTGSATDVQIALTDAGPFLPLAGGTMAGTIDMAKNDFINCRKILINTVGSADIRRVVIGNGTVQAGIYGVSLGENAGQNTTEADGICIGRNAGTRNGQGSICIGALSGGSSAVASDCVNIGCQAGRLGESDFSVIIGNLAHAKGANSVVIGNLAQNDDFGHTGSIIIGDGATSSAANDIVLHATAANIVKATTTTITHQGASIAGDFKSDGSVAMTGSITNLRTDDTDIALGVSSGSNGTDSISIGNGAGNDNLQGTRAVAIGYSSGAVTQGLNAVAVGDQSGSNGQGNSSVAVGTNTGKTNQGTACTAVGAFAGETNQQSGAVAVGLQAGRTNQGVNAISIGNNAGLLNQASASILINAHSVPLNTVVSNHIILQAGTTQFAATTTTVTHQGVSIAGDFKSDGTVAMTGDLTVPTINGLSPLGGKWSSTVPVTTVYNPVPTFTSLFGATGVGSLSVPANGFLIGDTGKIKLGGVITSPNNGNYVMRIVAGNPTDGLTQIWTSGAVSIPSVTTAQFWEIELEFTVRSLGAAEVDNLGFNGTFRHLTNGNNMEGLSIVPSPVSFDTTIENIFGADIQLNTAGMSITTHVANLSTLY